jgi:hypothetical protein
MSPGERLFSDGVRHVRELIISSQYLTLQTSFSNLKPATYGHQLPESCGNVNHVFAPREKPKRARRTQ